MTDSIPDECARPGPPRFPVALTHSLIAVLVALCLSGPLAAVAQSGPATGGVRQEEASDDAADQPSLAERWTVPDGLPALPDTSAEAIFVGDIESGQVLFAQDADVERDPASTAKIATSLVIVETLTDLDETITVEDGDTVDITVFSNAELAVDDEVTVEGLLYGLMLPSGNDAARALARTAGLALDPETGDPTATFLDAVNARVQELGAANTVILNPAGEDTEGQHTTARDLAILAAALLDNEVLAEIVSTPAYGMVVGGLNPRTVNLTNTNQLLGEDGIIGVKTGSTEAAGACLVTGAVFSQSSRVVIVVLGSDLAYDTAVDKRFEDTLAVIRAVPQEYSWVDLTATGSVEGLTEEMAAWQVSLPPGAELIVSTGSVDDLSYRLILGPVADSGDVAGRVLFFVGEKQIADQPVYQL